MLNASLISKYSVSHVAGEVVSCSDFLFGGSSLDPEMQASEQAWMDNYKYWDISFAITQKGHVVAQLIVFKNSYGYERYIQDGVVIFDNKEV